MIEDEKSFSSSINSSVDEEEKRGEGGRDGDGGRIEKVVEVGWEVEERRRGRGLL